MDTMTIERTLGDLVAENPARADILESLGLDFCCGGSQRLDEACLAAGLDPATVARLLQKPPAMVTTVGEEPDVRTLSLTALVDHIEATHHAFMKRALPRLAQLATKVSEVHGEHHPHLREMKETLAELTAEIELHLGKEEAVLFPAIRTLEANQGAPEFHCGHLANPITVMEHEHDQAGAALARLRELSDGYTLPEGACETFAAYYEALQALERDLHRHIHKENNVLFPRTLAVAGKVDDEAVG